MNLIWKSKFFNDSRGHTKIHKLKRHTGGIIWSRHLYLGQHSRSNIHGIKWKYQMSNKYLSKYINKPFCYHSSSRKDWKCTIEIWLNILYVRNMKKPCDNCHLILLLSLGTKHCREYSVIFSQDFIFILSSWKS